MSNIGNVGLNGMSGSQRRTLKREFDPRAFSRRAADQVITATTDIALIEKFAEQHPNKHVKRHAKHRVEKLKAGTITVDAVTGAVTDVSAGASLGAAVVDLVNIINNALAEPNPEMVAEQVSPAVSETAEPSEFDRLVARFKAEGKPNPEKSARSSMAAKAQAAAKRAKALGASA